MNPKAADDRRNSMKRILLTGFEPFGGSARNPSAEVARALDGTPIGGALIVGRILPSVLGKSRKELIALIQETSPSIVLCLGLAGGRQGLSVERVAINVDDARIADNAGNQPVDTPVIRGGPVAYWSTLPIKAIVRALAGEGIPATVSQTAGTFVCNHVFYALMHALAGNRSVRAGFIHVPFLPEQAASGQASMPFDLQVRGVRIALGTALAVRRDVRLSGGATH